MLKAYSLDDAKEWDEIVRSFKQYEVYNLSGYCKALEVNGDGEPLLIFFQGSNTKAFNVVIKRDISKDVHFNGKIPENTYFDFITPYGYGGFIIEGNETTQLFKEYETYCLKQNIISEFVRFNPLRDNWKYCNIYQLSFVGNTVRIDTSASATIWDSLHSKNRNMIRKAIKSGIKISFCHSKEVIDNFIQIYNPTMEKRNADQYYFFEKDYYESLYNGLSQNSIWVFASLNNMIISSAIFLFANGNMHYHLSGSNPEYQHLAPSNLLLYETAKLAKELNMSSFHLGGGVGCKEDSLYKFKKSFYKGNDSEFWVGKKIWNEDLYSHLVSLRKENELTNNSGFFPLYRA